MQILEPVLAKERTKISREVLKFTGESFLSENTDNSGSCITGGKRATAFVAGGNKQK